MLQKIFVQGDMSMKEVPPEENRCSICGARAGRHYPPCPPRVREMTDMERVWSACWSIGSIFAKLELAREKRFLPIFLDLPENWEAFL